MSERWRNADCRKGTDIVGETISEGQTDDVKAHEEVYRKAVCGKTARTV
jgi:hypothetical protein